MRRVLFSLRQSGDGRMAKLSAEKLSSEKLSLKNMGSTKR